MSTRLHSASGLLGACAMAVAALWPLQAHALFGDDEARRAIIDLRQKVEASQKAADAANTEMRESDAATRRSLLELANQIEQLRSELARLRGQNEQLAREVSELQRQQKDVQANVDERLRKVEPLRVEHDGQMDLLRKSEFGPAAGAFNGFLQRYPASGYRPSVLYWLGNAQYAIRDYKESVDSHRRLVSEFPSHLRTPEAMLAMANSQIELKDTKGSRRTLDDLVKTYPNSEAATAARERLARLR